MMTGPRITPKAMTHDERYEVMQSFSRNLLRMGTADVYWLPATRRLAFRCASESNGRSVTEIREESIYAGRFTHGGMKGSEFVNELDEFLAAQESSS